ncbi:MAG: succinate dehydrogenase, cytochrome b556 subunit [Steroidobacteraceae bacterium]
MSTPPLSPHLGVYRFMYTMALSISHRISGLAMSIGLIVLCAWLVALAAGQQTYAAFMVYLGSWPGQALLAALLLAFIYHFCNGIRHLLWDSGRGLERAEARRSAVITIAATLLLYGFFFYLLFLGKAGLT